jgi:hypothetical protein
MLYSLCLNNLQNNATKRFWIAGHRSTTLDLHINFSQYVMRISEKLHIMYTP